MNRFRTLFALAPYRYDSNSWRTETGDVALGHITNYAQNMDGTVWDLERLQQHMGRCIKGAWGSGHRKGSCWKAGQEQLNCSMGWCGTWMVAPRGKDGCRHSATIDARNGPVLCVHGA